MHRRALLLIIAAAIVTPSAALAQQTKRVVAFFMQGTSAVAPPETLAAFNESMKEQGYVAGRDFDVVTRFANDQLDRLPALAQEVVALKPEVIITQANAAPAAAKATATIPIIGFGLTPDVALDLAGNFSRPMANFTGIVPPAPGNKVFELAREVFPTALRIGWIDWTPLPGRAQRLGEVEAIMKTMNMQPIRVEVATRDDLPAAFQMLARERAEAVVFLTGSFYNSERARLAELANQARIPSVFAGTPGVEAGGLMGYGINMNNNFRAAATYVASIFNGAQIADLPVQTNVKLDLAINQKTAALLGVRFPAAVLERADIVIQ